MISEGQLKRIIRELELKLESYREILETKKDAGFGRPVGSIKYTEEQIKFLEDNKDNPMPLLILEFNERFGTKFKPDSRALYNFMMRQGIIEVKPREEVCIKLKLNENEKTK